MNGDLCKHLLRPTDCSFCIPSGPACFSGGGVLYHKTPECPVFKKGRDGVADRGGKNEPIEWTTEHQAKRHKNRCRVCFPGERW